MMKLTVASPDSTTALVFDFETRPVLAEFVHELIEMGEGDVDITVREEDEDGNTVRNHW